MPKWEDANAYKSNSKCQNKWSFLSIFVSLGVYKCGFPTLEKEMQNELSGVPRFSKDMSTLSGVTTPASPLENQTPCDKQYQQQEEENNYLRVMLV